MGCYISKRSLKIKRLNLICSYYILVIIVGGIQVFFVPRYYPDFLNDPLEIYYTSIRAILSIAIILIWMLKKVKPLIWLIIIESTTNFYFTFFCFFELIYAKFKYELQKDYIILYLKNNWGFPLINLFLISISLYILFYLIKNFERPNEI